MVTLENIKNAKIYHVKILRYTTWKESIRQTFPPPNFQAIP